jgi:hypothetical protein
VKVFTRALDGTQAGLYWLDFEQWRHGFPSYVASKHFVQFVDDLFDPPNDKDRLLPDRSASTP